MRNFYELDDIVRLNEEGLEELQINPSDYADEIKGDITGEAIITNRDHESDDSEGDPFSYDLDFGHTILKGVSPDDFTFIK